MADDVMQLQRQAARRVQRMQEHTRRVFEEHQGRTPESLEAARTPGWPGPAPDIRSPGLYRRPTPPEPVCDTVEHTEPEFSMPAADTHPEHSPDNPLQALSRLDTEQWLLLGLALLLFRSGCRPELTLALLYLAM